MSELVKETRRVEVVPPPFDGPAVPPRMVDRLMGVDRCLRCGANTAKSGPFLCTGIDIAVWGNASDVEVCFCAGCTTAILKPLSVVPAAKHRSVLDRVRKAETRAETAERISREALASAGDLAAKLGIARDELESAKSSLVRSQNLLKGKQARPVRKEQD